MASVTYLLDKSAWVYKVYAESFLGPDHLARVQEEAQSVVLAALGG